MAQDSPLRSDVFEYENGSDPHAFRNAMSGFATGVTVVTTMAGQKPVGVTANSFTSVSLDPPLVLVCLGKSLGCVDAFAEAGHFSVNVLNSHQRALSVRFATKGIDRFKDTDWYASQTRAPMIRNALANIECAKHAQIDYGDHTIFIGEVLHAIYNPNLAPLLYFGGEYRSLLEG